MDPLSCALAAVGLGDVSTMTGMKAVPRHDVRGSLEPALIGRSSVMGQIRDEVDLVARETHSVLLLGETGVGKGLIAEAIHWSGPRAQAPFVAVNLAALTESLLQSELFGHAKGAFTGAAERRAGAFVRANGGTLFLDEISEATPTCQAALLRAVEDKLIVPAGSDDPVPVDVRIIAASNRTHEEIVGGMLRPDLYQRLSHLVIEVPPLRERIEDIEPLMLRFLEARSRNAGERLTIERGALDILEAHPWPGNVREVLHVADRIAMRSTDAVVTAAAVLRALGSAASLPSADFDVSLPELVDDFKRRRIRMALAAAGRNVSAAARLCKIPRQTLRDEMHRLGITEGEATAPADDLGHGCPSGIRPRVLVIDDDVQVLAAMRRALQGRFEVSVAQSGGEAASLLAKAPCFEWIAAPRRDERR